MSRLGSGQECITIRATGSFRPGTASCQTETSYSTVFYCTVQHSAVYVLLLLVQQMSARDDTMTSWRLAISHCPFSCLWSECMWHTKDLYMRYNFMDSWMDSWQLLGTGTITANHVLVNNLDGFAVCRIAYLESRNPENEALPQSQSINAL